MKIIVKLLLFFFLTFLSAPTLVSLIEKKGDISFFYDNSETEDFQKELKTEFIFETFTFVVFIPQKNNLSKHDNISQKIIILPPDTI
jgi:hypothetical protein